MLPALAPAIASLGRVAAPIVKDMAPELGKGLAQGVGEQAGRQLASGGLDAAKGLFGSGSNGEAVSYAHDTENKSATY